MVLWRPHCSATLCGAGAIFSRMWSIQSQQTTHVNVSPIAVIHVSNNQGMGRGVVLSLLSPMTYQWNFHFQEAVTLGSADVEILFSPGKNVSTKGHSIPSGWKWRLPCGRSPKALCASEPTDKGEWLCSRMWLILTVRGNKFATTQWGKEVVWNTGDPDDAWCSMFYNETPQPRDSQEGSWHRLFRNEGLGHHQEGNHNQPLAEGEEKRWTLFLSLFPTPHL